MNFSKLCIIFAFFVVGLCGCKSHRSGNEKFDKERWAKKDDTEYPNRNAMLNDLKDNCKLKGLSYQQLTELLGEPEQSFSSKTEPEKIYYEIITDYGYGIDPVYSKTLMIKLNSDSTVNDFEIEEWKK